MALFGHYYSSRLNISQVKRGGERLIELVQIHMRQK
jgi:hypothetical protein